jgi:uracil-DNA glycosylase
MPEKSADRFLADQVSLESSWKARLQAEFCLPYMSALRDFLCVEKAAGKEIFPPHTQIFAALNACPFDQVKVVILGQDPYHGPGQAHGLSFSVREGVPLPPSLVNIFKEIASEFGISPPKDGDLSRWARQGVLLLNAVLTVESGKPESHRGKGWERLTDKILETLNREREGLVFVLWGTRAQAKSAILDSDRHLILSAPHPSPLSAYRGFFGCGHFRMINEWLEARGLPPVDWN